MISHEEVSTLIRQITDQSVEITGEIGSEVNHTYYVTIGNYECVAKIMSRKPLSQVEKNRFLKTKLLLDLVHKQGVPVPQVIHADNTTRELEGITVSGMLILERLPGKSLDVIWESLGMEQKRDFTIIFAQMLKKIHKVEFEKFGDLDPENAENGFRTWQDYILGTTQRAYDKLISQNVMDVDLLHQAVDFIQDNLSLWAYTGPSRLIHNDIWRANFFRSANEYYLLDWEWSFRGDPFYDFLWIESEMFRDEPQELIDLFYEKYGIDHRTDQNQIKKRCLSVFASLCGCAFGFIYHNPSEESYRWQEKLIRQSITGIPEEKS